MRADEFRWQTPLGHRLRDYRGRGVSALVQDLRARGVSITVRGVQHWTSGRAFPSFESLEAVYELSGGTISPNDFFEHRRQILARQLNTSRSHFR